MKKTTHAEVKTMTKHFESNKAASIAMLIEVTTNVSMTLEETRKLSGQRANVIRCKSLRLSSKRFTGSLLLI